MSDLHMVWPRSTNVSSTVVMTTDVIDAATERSAMFGKVGAWHWKSGTKNVTGVEFYATSVTQGTGTTTVRAYLTQLATAAGPPQRDDGDLTYSGTLALTSITANTLFTITFGTPRTVNIGDSLCVGLDYAAFGVGPALTVRAWSPIGTSHSPGVTSFIGTPAWTAHSATPAVALVCDDGTRIYFTHPEGMIASLSASAAFNSGTTGTAIDQGDERGTLWVPRKSWILRAGVFYLRCSNVLATAELVLYRDNTVLWSEAVNPYRLYSTGNVGSYRVHFGSDIKVYPGDNIRFTLRPTNTTAGWYVSRWQFVNTVDLLAYLGGTDEESQLQYTQRVDQGSWVQPGVADRSFADCSLLGSPDSGRSGFGAHIVGSSRF